MSNNIGRNDPCPCGSGQKYKKCCLIKSSPDPSDFKKKRWSLISRGLVDKLLKHIEAVYGPEAIEAAWDEFHLYNNEEGFDAHSRELPLFMPWFFYQWSPLDDELEGCPEVVPALSLLNSGRGLSTDEKNYLQACLEGNFSFFEILEVNPGKSMLGMDLLRDQQFLVIEKSATQVARAKHIFFGMVIVLEDISILEACSSVLIPPGLKGEILDLRKTYQRQLKHKLVDFHEGPDIEVLEVYQSIHEHLVNPPKPIFTNTDGHILIPHKLTFTLDNPLEAFEALHSLCVNATREELLQDAKFASDGLLVSIEFPWLKKGNKKNKSWDTTILGQLAIKGNELVVEVNSKERSRKFKMEIKKRLPDAHKLKSTVLTPVESVIKNAAPIKSNDDLMKNPEVIKKMEDMMKAHWDRWIYEKLPALNGKSPVEAMKTKKGKESLEILLNQFEREFEDRPMIGQTVETIKDVRKRLGL